MAREHFSTADRFIAVMGDLARMDHGMTDDAAERYAVWRLKDAAEAAIADAITAAQRYVDACRMMRQAADDLRAAAIAQEMTDAKG